ncbi:MAG: hypothetical protein KZQ83_18295 [gamma proteobacterium symbiont of Taylorina sp.]|nr:hypothetical protein [gamma proteobacterium symbiont of Taylorina sp.]
MNKFRNHLKTKKNKLNNLYNSYSGPIQAGELVKPSLIWEHDDLICCEQRIKSHSANVIFPQSVNLLSTSIFFDQIYIHLNDFTPEYRRINSEDDFRKAYQMSPSDFIELVRVKKVVPILSNSFDESKDYFLQEILSPILTNNLPYMTFEGHALICQMWQKQHNAFPDPEQQNTWGFLMDICSSLGIKSNLVRPELNTDLWDKHLLIFDIFKLDNITKYFQGNEVSLNNFFISTELSYDSRLPIKEYLSAFEDIDRKKVFSIYKNLKNKDEYYEEIIKINKSINLLSDKIDSAHQFKKILSSPMVLLFYYITGLIAEIYGSTFINAVKKMTDSEFIDTINKRKMEFIDKLAIQLEKDKEWANVDNFSEVMELVKIKRVLKNKL